MASASGSTTLTGTSSNDTLIGGSGNDALSGGAGSDFLNGGSGNDILDGGSGGDTLLGGSGSDILIYRAWENLYNQTSYATYDVYDGGTGAVKSGSSTPDIDQLHIYLSADQLADAAFMAAFNADLAAYESFIASQTNSKTLQASPAQFTFTSINLKVSAIESVAVIRAGQTAVMTESNVAESTSGSVVADGSASFVAGSCTTPFGTFHVNADGTWTFVAASAFDELAVGEHITQTFNVQATDGSIVSVTVTLNGTNDGPVANADSGAAGENQTISIDVLANDSDVDDGAVLSLVSASAPSGKGTASIVAGAVQFDPGTAFDHLAAGATEQVTVTYTMQDEHGAQSSSTAVITITGTNDGPISSNGSGSTSEDTPLTSSLPAASDVDDGDSVTYSLGAQASHGTAVVNADGTFTYTPTGDYNGSDSFTFSVSDGHGGSNTYTYTITVGPVNDAPSSSNGSGSTSEDTALSSSLPAANDADGDSVSYALGTQASHGTVVVNADGTFTYTPNADYNGSDSFTFTVSDGHGGSNSYTYDLTVNAVADIVGDSVTVNANSGANNLNLLANDTFENSGRAITSVTSAAHGTVTINDNGTSGNTADDFVVYTPNAGYSGSDSFTYTVTSGGVTETATVNVTVNAAAATAVNDKLVVSTGTVATFSASVLTANDLSQLQVGSVAGAAVTSGALVFDAATQTFTYDSTTGVGAGALSFTYTLSDGSTASVTFDVVNANPGFDLTANYGTAGSYQGSYLDAGGGNDNLTGAAAPDLLVGGSGNDTLIGGSGADILRGGGGNDTLDGQGDPGQFDLIDFSDGAAGITFTLTQSSSNTAFNTGAANLGTDTYKNIEGVIGTNFNDTLNGSGLADELRGGGGNDTLNGNGGNDILKGDSGNDTMTGGAGSDTFVLAATGIDTITDYNNVAGNADIIDITQILSVPTGTDVVTGGYVRVTTTGLVQVDANGGGDSWVTVANVNTGAASYTFQYVLNGAPATVSVTPVAPPIGIDLDGDGSVGFVGTDAGVTFDYGFGKVATAWVAPEDGILVRDANADGQVTADEMVFSTGGSDLEGLAVYDTNHDGQLSSADADFNQFAVWQDANSNGVVDCGEMTSLTALGIASISLTSDGVGYSAADGDVSVVGTGSFTRTDGSTGVLADSVFATGSPASDTQKQTLEAVNSNAAFIGAIAAAGLMAIPLHAEVRPASDVANDVLHASVAPFAAQTVALQPTEQNHALTGETHTPAAAPTAEHTDHVPFHAESSSFHGLGSVTGEHLLQHPVELLRGDEARTDIGVPQLAVPHATSAVSAEMLQAALAGIGHQAPGADPHAVSEGSESVQLGHVLADALAGGAHGYAEIDSLLHGIGGNGHSHGPLADLFGSAHEAFAGIHHHAMVPVFEAMAVHEAATHG
jgi:VCBS repeat-containing protein